MCRQKYKKSGIAGEARRFVLVIGLSIKHDFKTNFWQKFPSNFNTIISVNLNFSKMAVFCVSQKFIGNLIGFFGL
jgi:hypothetical protein